MEQAKARKKIDLSNLTIFFVLIALCVFFSIMNREAFLTVDNFFNIARQVSMMGITAVGMTFVMLIGGFDLSVGSMQALAGVIVASMMVTFSLPVPVSIIITVLVAGGVGAVNGLIVTRLNVNAFIATLSMTQILRGIAFVLTGAFPITNLPPAFTVMGQGYVGDVVPIPVIIMAVVFVFGLFILNKTYIGRHFYSVGGNAEAARLSGINVKMVKMIAFILCGMLASIAGLILAGRLNSGQPNAGQSFEFDVITACVLGGISLEGGQGRLLGTLLGVLIMGVLANGMIIMSIGKYYQWIIKGVVLIAAVAVDGLKAVSTDKRLNRAKA